MDQAIAVEMDLARQAQGVRDATRAGGKDFDTGSFHCGLGHLYARLFLVVVEAVCPAAAGRADRDFEGMRFDDFGKTTLIVIDWLEVDDLRGLPQAAERHLDSELGGR